MAQVCDFVYVMWVERLERWSMVGHLGAIFAASQGSEEKVPDPFKARADFEEWLISPLDAEPADREQRELIEALGIGG